MEKTSQKPRVVILGAGFGGLTAARAMADFAHVTVVDRHNFQTFLPLLYQVSTAGLAADVAKKSPSDKVHEVLRRTLQRKPKQDEIDRGTTFIKDSMNKDSLSEEDALRRFCLIAFSLNEFIFLN